MNATPLTIEQRRLVRYALGLPNQGRRSTRNAYLIAKPGHSAIAHWEPLVIRGLAREGQTQAGTTYYAASRRCAQAVLERDEGLCDAHFQTDELV